MTASLIELETLDLVDAAQALAHRASEPLALTVRRSFGVLQECAGMAGSDPGGSAWAAAYDRSAAATTAATTSAIQGAEQLARMFVQTARNYEAADAASTVSARRRLGPAVAHLPAVATFWLPACMPPAAGGSSTGGPPGWHLIQDAVGYVWPNGHQDQLRRAASAWWDSALALSEAAEVVTDAPKAACRHQLPESDDMWTVCWSVGGNLRELADVHTALGSACDELADRLDRMHSEVLGELRSLVEWSAGIQVAGGLLAVVSFGMAEVPTQAAETARVARTAALVAACIERFLAAARALTAAVGPLADRAAALGARLSHLLDIRLLEPALAGVGPIRVLHEGKEIQAAARLEGEAGPNVALFADRQAARQGLPGELSSISNRFFRGATSKSRNFKITKLEDGGFRMEFFSPANNVGYGKMYVQVVDANGRILKRFKDTLGPNGLIERKWLHE